MQNFDDSHYSETFLNFEKKIGEPQYIFSPVKKNK